MAGDTENLARFATAACLLAAERGARPEAILHGESALTVGRHLAPDTLADLKAKLGQALTAMARTDEAIGLLGDAVAHWRAAADGPREAEALGLLSSALMGAGETAESVAAIERSIEILQRHPPGPELASAYVRLTSAHMLARDRDTAVAWGERAIALATDLADPVVLGRALVETGVADVMDGRFEGVARVRQGIEIGRRHDLPLVVSAGLLQLGSGCGEMRRYDLAVPALLEDVAFSGEHSIEYNRRYSVGWLGRCRFDLGQWDEAEAHARDALTGPRSVAIACFVGANTLGWLRARRGDDDVWPMLDEALDIARRTRHLQRLWPVAVARAEAGWLESGTDEGLEPHVALLEEVLTLALVRRVPRRRRPPGATVIDPTTAAGTNGEA